MNTFTFYGIVASREKAAALGRSAAVFSVVILSTHSCPRGLGFTLLVMPIAAKAAGLVSFDRSICRSVARSFGKVLDLSVGHCLNFLAMAVIVVSG